MNRKITCTKWTCFDRKSQRLWKRNSISKSTPPWHNTVLHKNKNRRFPIISLLSANWGHQSQVQSLKWEIKLKLYCNLLLLHILFFLYLCHLRNNKAFMSLVRKLIIPYLAVFYFSVQGGNTVSAHTHTKKKYFKID